MVVDDAWKVIGYGSAVKGSRAYAESLLQSLVLLEGRNAVTLASAAVPALFFCAEWGFTHTVGCRMP